MNIIITLYSADRTGASKMCYYTAEKLLRQKHNVILLHGKIEDKNNSYIGELEEMGAKAHHVQGLSNPFYIIGIIKVFYFGRKYKADQLISYNLRDRIVGVIAARLLKIKSLVHCQNKHTYAGNFIVRNFKYLLYKNTVIKYADHIICASKIIYDELVGVYNCNPGKLSLAYNGIKIKPESEMARRTVNSDRLQISFVGRLDRQKGLHILLQSIKLIRDGKMTNKDFFVTIVGDVTESVNQGLSIDYKNDLINYVNEHQLNDLVGFLPFQKSVDAVLANTDIYIQPSLWEGLPLAVLEAMNYKLPLVITDECGFPDSFKDNIHGIIVKNNNAELLAAGLSKMINLNQTEREAYGLNAYNLLKSDFNIEATTDKVLQTFR